MLEQTRSAAVSRALEPGYGWCRWHFPSVLLIQKALNKRDKIELRRLKTNALSYD